MMHGLGELNQTARQGVQSHARDQDFTGRSKFGELTCDIMGRAENTTGEEGLSWWYYNTSTGISLFFSPWQGNRNFLVAPLRPPRADSLPHFGMASSTPARCSASQVQACGAVIPVTQLRSQPVVSRIEGVRCERDPDPRQLTRSPSTRTRATAYDRPRQMCKGKMIGPQ